MNFLPLEKLFIAISIICLDGPIPSQDKFDEQLYVAVTETAKALEIHTYIDNSAMEFNTWNKEDLFPAYLKTLQDRFKECKSFPYLSELKRFPNNETTKEMAAFGESYVRQMQEALPLFPEFQKQRLIDEIECHKKALLPWKYLQDSRWPYYSPNRRSYLNDLRTEIGTANFYSGKMPPPLDLRFIPYGSR